jgi:hypothetical protein
VGGRPAHCRTSSARESALRHEIVEFGKHGALSLAAQRPAGNIAGRVAMRARSTGSDEVLFELRFQPTVALASTVRKFVCDFYRELLDAEMSNKLAMATHEMLENACHYSIDRRSELVIALHRIGAQYVVTIRTKNRASDERLDKVRRALDEVVGAEDPAALYNQLVRRAAKRQDGGSGLGLGRIRAEADLSLSYAIEGDTIIVTAEGQFQPCGGPRAAPVEA